MFMQILVITDDWLQQNLNENTKTALGYGKLEMDATVYSEAPPLTYETTRRHILKERRENLRSHEFLSHLPKQFWNERADRDLHERSS
jgi:chaperonin cofactor prefoldin